MQAQLHPWEIDVLRQFISGRVVDARGRRVVNGGTGLFTGDFATEDQIGTIIANALTADILNFNTSVVFSATDFDTVAWTSGTLTLSSGDSFAISAGNTGNMTLLTYIYFDPTVSATVLQVTTNFANAVGENIILLCVAKPALSSIQSAFFVPSVGVFGINETVIGPNSISTSKIQALAITTNELAANSVTAAKINVAQLSAISVDAGSLTAGTITGLLIRTASSGARVEIDSTNGFRGIDSSGNVLVQVTTGGVFTLKSATSGARIEIDATNGMRVYNSTGLITQIVQGAALGYIVTSTIKGMNSAAVNGGLSLVTDSSNTSILLDEITDDMIFVADGSTRLTLSSAGISGGTGISFICDNGQGLKNGSNNASIALPSGAAELYGSGGIGLQADGADSGTDTGILIQGDGSLRRVTIDNSDLGTGAKRYLYLA